MERLGITVGMEGASLGDALENARRAESLGYTDAWTAEVAGPDGLTPLAVLAAMTDRLRLGTAILPVFTRPPALMAMGAAALADLSRGRFVLGLGTSSDVIIERWMGLGFDRPLTRMREYVAVLRSAFAGDKVSYAGRTVEVSDFRLQHDPKATIPIYLAALGPKACRLAGEVADGVALFLKTPVGVRRALQLVAEGAGKAGRDLRGFEAIIRLPVIMGGDERATAMLARRTIVAYAVVDVYNRSLADQGYAEEARAIAAAWASGDRKGAVAAVSDRMVEDLVIIGGPRDCRSKIEAFRKAGIGTPILLPMSAAKDPGEAAAQIEETTEALAPTR
jgi:probable F420-dependent oxidoreductase